MKKIILSLFIGVMGVLAVPTPAVFASDGVGGSTENTTPGDPSSEAKDSTANAAHEEAYDWYLECQKHTGWAVQDECAPIEEQYFQDYWNWSAREYAYALGENVYRVPKPARPGFPPQPTNC